MALKNNPFAKHRPVARPFVREREAISSVDTSILINASEDKVETTDALFEKTESRDKSKTNLRQSHKGKIPEGSKTEDKLETKLTHLGEEFGSASEIRSQPHVASSSNLMGVPNDVGDGNNPKRNQPKTNLRQDDILRGLLPRAVTDRKAKDSPIANDESSNSIEKNITESVDSKPETKLGQGFVVDERINNTFEDMESLILNFDNEEVQKLETKLVQPNLQVAEQRDSSLRKVISASNVDKESREDKLETNLRQTQDESQVKATKNLIQTQDKPETDKLNLRHRVVESKTQPRTQHKTNLSESADKAETTDSSFSMLVGLQRRIAVLVYESCKLDRKRQTPPMAIEHIAKSVNTSVSSARKTIQRLEEKQILTRPEFKNGRGGWTKYELSEYVFREMLIQRTGDNVEANLRQTNDKVKPQLRTQHETNSSSSNREIENNYPKSNTTDPELESLPIEWRTIDYLPLNEQHCLFGPKQIRQAKAFSMSAAALQESIYHFAWALEQKWKPKGGFQTGPLNYLMGCLRTNGVFEHDGYYRQKIERAEREKSWLEECRRKEHEAYSPRPSNLTSSATEARGVGNDPIDF